MLVMQLGQGVRATLITNRSFTQRYTSSEASGLPQEWLSEEGGGSYSLRCSHWFSGKPKRTQLESLGINYSLYILQDMCLQCVLHVYYMCTTCGDHEVMADSL